MKMKIVQITDTHLVPRGEVLHGLDPCERLDACIDDINRHHRDAELCIITGDLVHNGPPHAYRDLKVCLSRLDIPCHLLVGNHDHRGRLLDEFPDLPVDENGFLQTVIETGAGRFFLLDTIEQGMAWGAYCEKRLAWLKNAIEAARDCPVYLFMHHPPFSVGLPCVDRLGLGTDGERLAEVVVPYANIRHLFFGHVHRPITGSWRGIPYSTMRGTNHQVPLISMPSKWFRKATSSRPTRWCSWRSTRRRCIFTIIWIPTEFPTTKNPKAGPIGNELSRNHRAAIPARWPHGTIETGAE